MQPQGIRPTATIVTQQGPSFLVRAIWYFCVGWWLAGLAIGFAYLCALTVVGLPLALMVFNRLGSILTLRPATQTARTTYRDGIAVVQMRGAQQRSFLVRALFFVLVGWWWSAIWIAIAYAFSLTIVGIPLGLMMMNRVGAALTLYRQ